MDSSETLALARLGVQVLLFQSGGLSSRMPKFEPPTISEIVGQAGMSNGEIILGGVHGFCILVHKRLVGIADYLRVRVIFHHDHEDVIEVWNAFGHRTFLRGRSARHGRSEQTQNCCFVHHRSHLVYGKSVEPRRGQLGLARPVGTLVAAYCGWVTAGRKLRERWPARPRIGILGCGGVGFGFRLGAPKAGIDNGSRSLVARRTFH